VLRDTLVEVNETLDDELFLFAAIRALVCVAVHERAVSADERGTGSPVLFVVWDVASEDQNCVAVAKLELLRVDAG